MAKNGNCLERGTAFLRAMPFVQLLCCYESDANFMGAVQFFMTAMQFWN